MFDELFDSLEGLKRELTVSKTAIPDIDLDDPTFFDKAQKVSPKNAVKIERDALAKEFLGDIPETDPVHELQRAADKDKELDLMLKAGGLAGKKLSRMRKASMTLEEGMAHLISSFEEFFSLEEQAMLERSIKALDLPAFFQLFNSRVGADIS